MEKKYIKVGFLFFRSKYSNGTLVELLVPRDKIVSIKKDIIETSEEIKKTNCSILIEKDYLNKITEPLIELSYVDAAPHKMAVNQYIPILEDFNVLFERLNGSEAAETLFG